MNATRSQLIAQYNRAKKLLWVEHFREAANAITPGLFDTADLMAIGSRETNLDPKWLTKKGDGGHGAGLMQIDDRSFPLFTNSDKWKDARLGILYGATVLRQKWDDLENTAGKSLKFKGNAFTGPRVVGIVAQQIAIAAYNSGRAAAYHYSKGRNPDNGTTGKDYSQDVMQRAAIFRELLAKDGMLDKNSAGQPQSSDAVSLQPDTSMTPGGQTDASTGEAPPTEITAALVEPVVEVPTVAAVKDETVDEKINKWSARWMAIPATVTTFLGGAVSFLTSSPAMITITLIIAGSLIAAVYFGLRQIAAMRKAAREDALKSEREQRAHEIQMALIAAAADKSSNTVQLVNPPLVETPNSDAEGK